MEFIHIYYLMAAFIPRATMIVHPKMFMLKHQRQQVQQNKQSKNSR